MAWESAPRRDAHPAGLRLQALPRQDHHHARRLRRPSCERTLAQGFGQDREEFDDHIRCAAIPIFDRLNQPVAGMSVSFPTFRYDPAREPEVQGRRQRLAGHPQQLQRRGDGPPGLGHADHRPAARRGRLPALVTMLQAISTTPTVPVVRVPWLEPGILMKALDAGAYGVICPMVNTREEAQKLVAYTHYAPQGHTQLRPGARQRCTAAPTTRAHANQTIVASR
jgi:hypothetical protein